MLSLLLLPQRRVAEAEASQLTAAVSAFSLLVFFFSALIAGRLALRVARPVADLVEGTRAVARGDFSPRLTEPPDEELKELVRAFLSMSRSLKSQTDALLEEKERIATLLAHLTAGVVAFREEGRVLLANPAAAALGGGNANGATIEEVFPGESMARLRRILEDPDAASLAVEIEPRAGERWRVVTVPLPLGGEGARMAVIEDVSDVVRSNRLAAWAEMARIIAHEIKNPLTPIRLAVEHLREVWRAGRSGFQPRSGGMRLARVEADRGAAAVGVGVLRLRAAARARGRADRRQPAPCRVGRGLCRSARDRLVARHRARVAGAGGRAPAGARALEPDRQRGGGAGRSEGRNPNHGSAAGLPRLRERRGHRPGRGCEKPDAPLRSVFLGKERRHGAGTGDREEDRGGARRIDHRGEPREERLPRPVRSPAEKPVATSV